MRRFSMVCSAIVFAVVICFSGMATAANNIVLIFSGDAVPNTHAQPNLQAFTDWCTPTCAPSVQQPMYDASTGQLKGKIYVWTTPFVIAADGNSLCFSEFIVFALSQGDIYTHSGPLGTCGGFIDPALKPATHAAQPAVVVGGGGDGIIVGGTGKYKNWTGTYTDRVFVELTFAPGGTNYYDQLFFSISPN